MHLYELGILKYVLMIFVDSMTPKVRADVDELIETLFNSNRSHERSKHLHVKFTGGATRLTQLHAHEWPGLAFAMLLMLLSEEGRTLCKGCFAEDGKSVKEFEWSTLHFPPHSTTRIERDVFLDRNDDSEEEVEANIGFGNCDCPDTSEDESPSSPQKKSSYQWNVITVNL